MADRIALLRGENTKIRDTDIHFCDNIDFADSDRSKGADLHTNVPHHLCKVRG